MAKKKADQKINTKLLTHDGERYAGTLYKKSKEEFYIRINHLSESEVKKEIEEDETYTERVEKLRPLNDDQVGASTVNKWQTEINKFLEKKTVSEALETDPEAEDKEARKIEIELGFKVERYIDEIRKVRKVKVLKNEVEVTEKKITDLPLYFRPSGGIVSKSISNYLKSK